MPASRAIGAIAFVVGAATLGAEIAAARLLGPWFGSSTIVWANTIATVLIALALGYELGGRWADRDPTLRGLCRVVLAGAVLLAAVPFVAGPFLRVSVDALDSVDAGAAIGSLLGVLVLLAAPVLVLGMVAPYCVRLALADPAQAGAVSGRLYGISTCGSLTGVFGVALLLVPQVGTQRTFVVLALACALVALVGLWPGPRAVLAPLGVGALLAVPVGTVKADAGENRVIWERETELQYARVVEREGGVRALELNEGQADHSVWLPDRVLTGAYWDEPLVLPFAARRSPPRSVAVLGGGAGTVARSFGHLFPDTAVDLVEIDGELLEAGRELFDLRGPRLRTHDEDARPWLRDADGRYDLLFIDAYRQPYIPFYLTTREFFELCRDRLAPGGVVVVNVGEPEGSDRVERVLSATMADVFRTVLRDPSEDTNTQLLAADAPVSAARLRAAVPGLPAPLRPVGLLAAERLAPALRGGDVFTDDKAPIEWLTDASIVQLASEGSP